MSTPPQRPGVDRSDRLPASEAPSSIAIRHARLDNLPSILEVERASLAQSAKQCAHPLPRDGNHNPAVQ